jgi:methyl coenzyme M reductase gamma subunit
MRRSILWLVFALVLAAACPRAARACPMCSEAVPATSGAEEDDATREARAYNNSIYLMAGVPYLMLSGFSIWVYRGLRRQALAGRDFTAEERP